jgi:hypothetical protein
LLEHMFYFWALRSTAHRAGRETSMSLASSSIISPFSRDCCSQLRPAPGEYWQFLALSSAGSR